MREWQRQSHVKWYCKYHIVFVPKYRKRVIFGSLRKGIGKILREECERHGVELVEARRPPWPDEDDQGADRPRGPRQSVLGVLSHQGRTQGSWPRRCAEHDRQGTQGERHQARAGQALLQGGVTQFSRSGAARDGGGDASSVPEVTKQVAWRRGRREPRPKSSSALCRKSMQGHELTVGAVSGQDAKRKKSSKSLRSMKLYVAWRVRGHALPAWFTTHTVTLRAD